MVTWRNLDADNLHQPNQPTDVHKYTVYIPNEKPDFLINCAIEHLKKYKTKHKWWEFWK